MSPQSVSPDGLSLAQTHRKCEITPGLAPRANPAEAIDRRIFFRRLERRCGKRDNSGAVAEPDTGIKQTSGGDERQRRTRLARLAGAPAAGASRSRCGDRRLGDVARIRPDPGPAPEKAQAGAARQDPPDRRSAHAGYHCVAASRARRVTAAHDPELKSATRPALYAAAIAGAPLRCRPPLPHTKASGGLSPS